MNSDNPELVLKELSRSATATMVSEEFRQTLRAKTSGHVRVRHRKRVISYIGVCAACYLFGIGSAIVWLRGDTPQPILQNELPDTTGDLPMAELWESRSTDLSVENPSPQALEIRAFEASTMERRRLLRLAGDQYLKMSDVGSATRCYARLLEIKQDAGMDPDDSWLLAALRKSIQREGALEHGLD